MFPISLKILSAIFLGLRRIQKDIIINVHRCSCKVAVCYSYQIVINLQIVSTDCPENFNSKFHEIASSGRRIVLCTETDRQTDLFCVQRETDKQGCSVYRDRQTTELFCVQRQTDSRFVLCTETDSQTDELTHMTELIIAFSNISMYVCMNLYMYVCLYVCVYVCM